MTDACLLIGDIGGTNARFALADGKVPGFSDECVLKCADFASADLAIKHYLGSIAARSPTAICLAAAGPIVDHRVRITNNDWDIAVDELEEVFSIKAVTLLNDFEAIAYSIPFLSHTDCMPIGLPEPGWLPDGDYTVGILGPGTGLGAVGLCKRAGNYIPVTGEAAHGGFAPESHVQHEILAVLRERFDRVSAERLVSGSGLENIHWALNRIHGDQRPHMSAAEIFDSGSNNSDLRAAESVQMFFEILGQVAGDLALTLGAEDGMYIAGGIVQRYPTLLVNSRFRSSFESKGRHRSLMERIPTQLIMHKQPGLLGASYFVSKELRVD